MVSGDWLGATDRRSTCRRRAGRRSIARDQPDAADHDTILVTALRKALHCWTATLAVQPVIMTALTSPYERRLMRLAFLAPDIQQAVLAGRQPRTLNLAQMMHQDLPITWSWPREMLGFSTELETQLSRSNRLIWWLKRPVMVGAVFTQPRAAGEVAKMGCHAARSDASHSDDIECGIDDRAMCNGVPPILGRQRKRKHCGIGEELHRHRQKMRPHQSLPA